MGAWSLFAALGGCTSSDAHTGDSATSPQQVVETVTYSDGLEGYLCVPAGEGPFPVAVLGFSRGGFLTVATLTERPDVSVGVVMAPAPVNGLLYSVLEDADQVQATTLVLVAENDLPEFNNENEDHVATATAVYDALVGADKEAELVILDAWEDNGHDLFQELRDEYWGRVTEFLASRL